MYSRGETVPVARLQDAAGCAPRQEIGVVGRSAVRPFLLKLIHRLWSSAVW